MKINLSVRSVVLMGMMCVAPLRAVQQEFDTYFKSPTKMALAPLRECFTQADDALKRSPDIKHREELFYSQAMSLYITKIYNSSEYARHLSQDSRHISDFLTIANEFSFNPEQVYTGLRLFYNKFKEAELIDDTAVMHVLEALPQQLEEYFPLRPNANSKPQRSTAKLVENMLLSKFTDHLMAPKVSTETFLQQVSEHISSELGKGSTSTPEAMREHLRSITLRLVEQMISKIVWYPQHYAGIWQSVMSMAHNIHLLCANSIITHLDHRDDAINSLVCRFCWFIEQYGGALPVDFYEGIEKDIHEHKVFFLEHEELDAGVKPKKERLLEALSLGKTKAIACQKHGLIPAEVNIRR